MTYDINKSLSSYWMNDWVRTGDAVSNSVNVYQLASGRRAISNFISILTNKNIPVTFNTRGGSYTDGKGVVIGSNIESPKDFDVAVGLALHEGSHIAQSDFTILGKLGDYIPDDYYKMGREADVQVTSLTKSILNYIEDRRIDKYVYTNSPGYQGYYEAMYRKYFYNKIIDRGLTSGEYRDETEASYVFRIINLHNKNTDLNALKGLRAIYNVIDLKNIDRLTTTEMALTAAICVVGIILANLVASTDEPRSDDNGNSDNGSDQSESDGNDDNETDSGGNDNNTDGDADAGGADGGSDDENQTDSGGSSMSGVVGDDDAATKTSSSNSDSNPNGLSDAMKKRLEKQIEKQKDFLDGDVKKKQITKKNANEIKQIDESGTELKEVGADVIGRWGMPQKAINVIVVKKLTTAVLEASTFPMKYGWSGGEVPGSAKYMSNGLRIGKLLGKKLQTRGESRTTVFNRQKAGRIDKRMISSLGFGNENVFQYSDIDSYANANIHISIDASSSMRGEKWAKTMTNAVALCKAVDMIPNLEVQVSFRTTIDSGNAHLPYIVMAYNSKVDSFTKVTQMFPKLYPNGTTPEGLCFEAILDQLIPSEPGVDSYFLNISDGQPYYATTGFMYGGDPASIHTRKMVKMIEGRGIKMLSYFISSSGYSSEYTMTVFRKMYGAAAAFVDVTNATQIIRTMNGLFLKK